MHLVMHQDVKADRESTWRFLSDPSSYGRFLEGLTRWTPLGPPRGGVGDRFRVHLRVGPAELGEEIEVVEFTPPADLAWVGVSGVDHRGRWRLRSRPDGGTHVELRMSYHTHGGLGSRLADAVAAPIVERSFRHSLATLDEHIAKHRRRAEAPR